MTAAAKQTSAFMLAQPSKPEALAWLKDARIDDAAPDWARALRQTAYESFAATGLPTPAQEGWQYTSLRDLSADAYTVAQAQAAGNDLPAPLLADAYRIVVVNGCYHPDLSCLPAGVTVAPVLEAAKTIAHAEEYLAAPGDLALHPFKALNFAHLRDGFVLALERGAVVDRPIEVLFFAHDGQASYPRILYWLGAQAQAQIVERVCGEGASFTSAVTDIVLQPGARLTHHRLVEDAEKAVHISHTSLHALRDAHYEAYAAALSGALTRQFYEFKLLEKGIYSSLTGIYLKKGQQINDFTVLAGHYDESGVSAQHFKGVVDDQARAVFQGKIHVHRSAQRTDGYQSHHALLLSDAAEVDAKPELEIYADDVKCSHGATAGQLDREALFYLRSRGIPDHEARALLIRSFLAEGVDKIPNPEIRSLYDMRIDAWLAARAQDKGGA